MAARTLDQTFREHEGDDYVRWIEGSAPLSDTGASRFDGVSAIAVVGQWVVVLAGSGLIAWLAV